MTTEEQYTEVVECPKCHIRYAADPYQEYFVCKDHGKISLNTGIQYRLQSDIAEIKSGLKQLENPISDKNSSQTIDKITHQIAEMEKVFQAALQTSPRIAPEPEVTFQKPGIHMVDARLVDEENDAFVVAGIAFGVFTLFLGVLVQTLIGLGSIGLLVFITIITGAATAYFYRKGYQHKQRVKDAAR
jgi:translation elongation factor EF-1beta